MPSQLEFRDMYACTEYCTPHFQQIRGNPFSRYIDWSLQNQHTPSGDIILPRPAGSSRDEEWFLRWKTGQTGFPWIDAVMRQLKQEGWIHHLARHSVACFLTRGQCYISWERGAEVFDQWLLDWDPCSNPGNWMWLSCESMGLDRMSLVWARRMLMRTHNLLFDPGSAYFSQYFRVYGLTSWPMKTDKHGLLVRKYCPELNGFPDKMSLDSISGNHVQADILRLQPSVHLRTLQSSSRYSETSEMHHRYRLSFSHARRTVRKKQMHRSSQDCFPSWIPWSG